MSGAKLWLGARAVTRTSLNMDEVFLYDGPDLSMKQDFLQLNEAVLVIRTTGTDDGHWYVRTAEGKEGWIGEDELAPITRWSDNSPESRLHFGDKVWINTNLHGLNWKDNLLAQDRNGPIYNAYSNPALIPWIDELETLNSQFQTLGLVQQMNDTVEHINIEPPTIVGPPDLSNGVRWPLQVKRYREIKFYFDEIQPGGIDYWLQPWYSASLDLPLGRQVYVAAAHTSIASLELPWRFLLRMNPHLVDRVDSGLALKGDMYYLSCPV